MGRTECSEAAEGTGRRVVEMSAGRRSSALPLDAVLALYGSSAVTARHAKGKVIDLRRAQVAVAAGDS
jgi:hypothetical protein